MRIATRVFIVLIIASAALGDERTEKRRLVSELLEVIDAKALVRASFENHMAAIGAFFSESGRSFEMDPEFAGFQEQLFARIDYNRYFDEVYVPLFEERFTAAELQVLIELFKTRHGAKLAQILPQFGLGAEGLRTFHEAAQAVRKDMEKEQAAKYPWRQTMSDLRSLATAVEALATDTNEYPAVAFEELEAILAPVYIREVPKVDGWGTPFLYVSDGKQYRFVSAGADRRFGWTARQLDLTATEPASSGDLDADIIFQDGTFLQSPQEVREHRD